MYVFVMFTNENIFKKWRNLTKPALFFLTIFNIIFKLRVVSFYGVTEVQSFDLVITQNDRLQMYQDYSTFTHHFLKVKIITTKSIKLNTFTVEDLNTCGAYTHWAPHAWVCSCSKTIFLSFW